jgi:hypothetical protein
VRGPDRLAVGGQAGRRDGIRVDDARDSRHVLPRAPRHGVRREVACGRAIEVLVEGARQGRETLGEGGAVGGDEQCDGACDVPAVGAEQVQRKEAVEIAARCGDAFRCCCGPSFEEGLEQQRAGAVQRSDVKGEHPIAITCRKPLRMGGNQSL